MSDLQCPARIYVVWPATGDEGAADARPAEDPGAVVHPTVPGSQVDLEEVADLYRGEAVLVVVDRPPRQLPGLVRGDRVAVEVDSLGVRLRSHR